MMSRLYRRLWFLAIGLLIALIAPPYVGLWRFTVLFLALLRFIKKNEVWDSNKYQSDGLSQEEISNNRFLDKWTEIREKGLWKYCINDGGFILGAGLSLALSIVIFFYLGSKFREIMADPGSLFAFIGYNYLGGAIAGIIIHRFLWRSNERKYMRLTTSTDEHPLDTFQK